MQRINLIFLLLLYPGLAWAHGPVELVWYLSACGILYVWGLIRVGSEPRSVWMRLGALIFYLCLSTVVWIVSFMVEDRLRTGYHWLLPALLVGGYFAIILVLLPRSHVQRKNDD